METNNEEEKIREVRVIVGKESFDHVYDVDEETGLVKTKPGIRVVAVHGYENPSEEGPISAGEQAQNEWVEETMMQFPFAESERYSEWKAYQALVKMAWQTPARDIVTNIKLRSRLLPNPTSDRSSYLRDNHCIYLALFNEAIDSEVKRLNGRIGELDLMQWYMFSLSRRSVADRIISQIWPHHDEPFRAKPLLEELEAHPTHVHPDSSIWTWDEFWEAVGTRTDKDLEILGYYVVIRWLQRQLFKVERTKQSAQSNVPEPEQSTANSTDKSNKKKKLIDQPDAVIRPITKATTTQTAIPKRESTSRKRAEELTYFRQQVRDGVIAALRKGCEPVEKDVLKSAATATIERRNMSLETLRKTIPPPVQREIFGKIYRDESTVKSLYVNGKK